MKKSDPIRIKKFAFGHDLMSLRLHNINADLPSEGPGQRENPE
jgi:hypothetical protein